MRIDPGKTALALAVIRMTNGLVLLTAPALAEFAYLGPAGRAPTARALARFTGAREVALGVLVVAAVTRGHGAEVVAAAAACDAVDCVISVCSPDVASRMRIAAPTAAASALIGLWTAGRLARRSEEERLPD